MRTLEQLKVEIEERKKRGTKQPFRLVYFFFCDKCRESIIETANPNHSQRWGSLRQALKTGCGCRRFLTRAEVNMQKHRRIEFGRTTWPMRSRIESIEKERVLLVKKSLILSGEVTKRQILEPINEAILWNTPTVSQLVSGFPNIRRIRTQALYQPNLSQQLNEIPTLSAGRMSSLSRKQFRPHAYTPLDYIEPYGWTYQALNRRIHPKVSA